MNTALLLLTIFLISDVKATNILLFPGLAATSLTNEMRGFGEELVERGHKAKILPSKHHGRLVSDRYKNKNFKISNFKTK